MYEPSEQDMQEAILYLTMEIVSLRHELDKLHKSETETAGLYVEAQNENMILKKELDEIKQAHATPAVLA